MTSLRRARKRKARVERTRAADARRAHEGESAAERAARQKRETLRARIVDGARRDPRPEG